MIEKIRKAFNKFLDVIFPFGVTCMFCGEEIDGKSENGLCKECSGKIAKVENQLAFYDYIAVYSACEYENLARKIILSAKDSDRPELIRIMALYIEEIYREKDFQCDFIAFVPSSKNNARKRGYDHMKICAQFLSDDLNAPVLKGLKCIGEKKDQTEVSTQERKANVKNKYVYEGESLKEKTVLLIDDIVTTGATLAECVSALKEAGAKRVVCVTFGRAA